MTSLLHNVVHGCQSLRALKMKDPFISKKAITSLTAFLFLYPPPASSCSNLNDNALSLTPPMISSKEHPCFYLITQSTKRCFQNVKTSRHWQAAILYVHLANCERQSPSLCSIPYDSTYSILFNVFCFIFWIIIWPLCNLLLKNVKKKLDFIPNFMHFCGMQFCSHRKLCMHCFCFVFYHVTNTDIAFKAIAQKAQS